MAALRILRSIEREALQARAGVIAAKCSLDVTLYILNHKRDWLKRIEDDYALSVEIVGDSTKAGDAFEIEKRGPARDLPPTAQVVRADQSEDIVVETPDLEEPVDETEDDAGAQDRGESRAQSGERSEGREDGGRRRRRRRRGGRRGDGEGQREGQRHGEHRQAREFAPEDRVENEADAGEPGDGDVDAQTDRSERAAGGEERNGENGDRKRRRRGRRGGRRNRGRTEQDGAIDQGGVAAEASNETGADIPFDDAQPYVDPSYVEVGRGPPRQSVEPAREFDLKPPEAPRMDPAPEPETPHVAALPDTPPKAEKVKKGWWQRAMGG
jgi:ribonuclease E